MSTRTSPRPRRSINLLPALIAPLLVCCAASSPAHARTKKPAAPTEVLEVELRELGGSTATREFVVPVDGKISGWTELFDAPLFCRLRSSLGADARTHLKIDCDDRSPRPDQGAAFELEVERALALGQTTLLGELEGRDGRRLQIVATRR